MQHNGIDAYCELNSTLKKIPQDKEASRNQYQAPVACNTASSYIGDGRGRALVKASNQHSSHP